MTTDRADQLAEGHEILRKGYDEYAASWDETQALSDALPGVDAFLSKWSWNGSILELGCGTGIMGAILRKHAPSAEIYGNDLSAQMAEVASKKNIYSTKVAVGHMTDALKTSTPVDHVASFGATCHLTPEEFRVVLSQMFEVAQKSITFTINDRVADIREMAKDEIMTTILYDHMDLWKQIETPPQWKLDSSDRLLIYRHPQSGHELYVHVIRYERV